MQNIGLWLHLYGRKYVLFQIDILLYIFTYKYIVKSSLFLFIKTRGIVWHVNAVITLYYTLWKLFENYCSFIGLEWLIISSSFGGWIFSFFASCFTFYWFKRCSNDRLVVILGCLTVWLLISALFYPKCTTDPEWWKTVDTYRS